MNNLNLHNNNLNPKNSSKSSSINKINNLASQNIISKINSNENKNIGETGIKMDIRNENDKIMKGITNNNQSTELSFNQRENINKLKTYEKIIEDQKNEIKNLKEKIQQLNNEIKKIKQRKLDEEKDNKFKADEILEKKDFRIKELERANLDKIKEVENLKKQFNSIQQELKDEKENMATIQKEKDNLMDIYIKKTKLENENNTTKKE